MFTSLNWLIMKKLKREIIQSFIYRILPNVNQVIYTLDTICDSNMTIAHAVLEIFFHKLPLGYDETKRKRAIIQSLIYRILPKLNQVIYTLYAIWTVVLFTVF